MILDMPYFMTNDRWYYFDKKTGKYMLTDEAPKKAKDSYIAFFEEVKKWNVNNGIKADSHKMDAR